MPQAEEDGLSEKVYIHDEIVVPHTRLAQIRTAYVEEYAPGARERGMMLEGAWRSPPIDLPDRESTLHFLWSVPDVGSWWSMRLASVEAKSHWWSFVDSIAISRKRTVMVDAGLESSDV